MRFNDKTFLVDLTLLIQNEVHYIFFLAFYILYVDKTVSALNQLKLVEKFTSTYIVFDFVKRIHTRINYL